MAQRRKTSLHLFDWRQMHRSLRNSNDNKNDAGLYTWDMATDTVYADFALANLFGLQKWLAERGLPLARYMERVHLEDQPALAWAIRQAILTGNPFQESYRVHRANGDVGRVLAFGRCFRDSEDQPKFYSGIVFAMPEENEGDGSLVWQCNAILEHARRADREDIASLLVEAIEKLGQPARH